MQAKAALRQIVGLREPDRRLRGRSAICAYTKHSVTLDDLKQRGARVAAGSARRAERRRSSRRTRSARAAATAPATSPAASSTTARARQRTRASASRSTCRSTTGIRATSRTATSRCARRRRQKRRRDYGPHRCRQRVCRVSDERKDRDALISPAISIRRKQSLDITTYVFQRGGGTLLDLLDAERTYRATELAFRQALAAYMTSVQQINFVVGKQVMQ